MFLIGFQDPASPIMQSIVNLHAHIMFYLVSITFFVFTLLFFISYEFGYKTYKPYSEHRVYQLQAAKVVHCTWLEVVWTMIPIVILVIIAIPSFALIYSMEEKTDPAITVKAIGHQWYWSYEYNVGDSEVDFDSYMKSDDDLNQGEFRLLEVDRTVVLPVSTPIRLLVSADDVIHSWALPAAGIKMDAIPGRLNQVNVFFNRTGVFYGQCSELCGVNHGFMPIAVKVVSVDRFKEWVAFLQ